MSFNKYRLVQLGVMAAVTLFMAASTAVATRKVDPVSNLHLVNGSASQVKIAWDAPKHGSTPNATIDQYIIKRDGHKINTLQGFNGLVDTSYIDGNPSQKKAVYAVIAVDSNGRRSPPTTLSIPAPQGANQSPQPGGGDAQPDIIQSSSLCDSIIPQNIRGHNQPTALEKYGCGAGMSAVNEKDAGKILGVVEKPRPFHDFFQNVFIQIPVSLGHTFFLLISALYIWVMNAGTYLSVGKLFANILQAFNGNPNMGSLIAIAVAIGVMVLGLNILKDEIRKGFSSFIRIAFVLAFLTVILSGPQTWMRFAVEKPLGVYSSETSQLTSMSAGTDVSRDFNLTVHPTYGGNKTYNAIRKAENADWLMWQYLPQCAINFRNFQWVINHNVPGTHTSFCERFVQVWSSGSDDDKDKFKEALKKSNKNVYDFFQGNDQMTRILYSVVSKLVLLMHNVMKTIMKLSILPGIFLLLGELLFMVIWLIASLTATDEAKYAAERRIRTMFHWLKIPAVLTLFSLVYLVVEANIISGSTRSGFLWVNGQALLLECAVAYGTYKYLKAAHRRHREAMERLGVHREQSNGWLGRAAGYALAGLTAGASEEYMRRRAGKNRRERPGTTTAGLPDYDITEHPDFHLLEEHTGNGRGYDTDGYAEEMVNPLQLGRGSGDGRHDGRSDGFDSPSNGSGPRGPHTSPGSGGGTTFDDGQSLYDEPIVDAVVVEDTDVMDRGSREERERRMDYDLREERERRKREEYERRRRREREERER
jgi:hypothetical protein